MCKHTVPQHYTSYCIKASRLTMTKRKKHSLGVNADHYVPVKQMLRWPSRERHAGCGKTRNLALVVATAMEIPNTALWQGLGLVSKSTTSLCHKDNAVTPMD